MLPRSHASKVPTHAGWRLSRLWTTLAALCLLLTLAAPVAAQTASPIATPTEQSDPTSRPIAAVPTASDADIAARLQRILVATGWFKSPSVEVREGVAFLQGTAETRERFTWATTLAGKTEGVVAVVNRMDVEADLSSTFDRAQAEVMTVLGQVFSAWPLMLLGVAIIIVSWFATGLVAAIARPALARRISSPLLLGVMVKTVSLPVFFLGIYFVLRLAGLTQLALTLLGGTGLVGIIIGFAFRDIAENFLASLLLSMRNPFNGGDLIEVAGYTGVVQNLNTRSTVLLTLDGNHVQIPNAMVYKSTIKNYSSIPSRRAEFVVGIGYDSSVVKAQQLIGDILDNHPAVLDDPEPLVLVDELGSATVNLRIFYWFNSDTYSPAKINSALLRLSKNALVAGGIELPDPAREVVFPHGVPISRFGASPHANAAAHPGAPAGEGSDATAAEGDLTSETRDIERRGNDRIPEAETNLLKD